MSVNNTIHTIGFRVQKYGTAEKQSNYTQNVFEADAFENDVFEF
jgi:hypothetical protein